jgi:hypothetical protein
MTLCLAMIPPGITVKDTLESMPRYCLRTFYAADDIEASATPSAVAVFQTLE